MIRIQYSPLRLLQLVRGRGSIQPHPPTPTHEKMEKFVAAWLLISSLIVLWDAGYVLLRPRSMPGGNLHWLWTPYDLYSSIDKRYGDLEDDFVYGQSWCNVFEIFFNLIAAFKLLGGARSGLVLGFLVCTMTLWKTFLYLILYTPLCSSDDPLAHTTWFQFIVLFLLTNGVWIILPLTCTVWLGLKINNLLNNNNNNNSSFSTPASKKKKQK